MNLKLTTYLALLTCLLAPGGIAVAQDFPTRPIRIVVANTAGTIADVAARALGQELSKRLGQPIIVDAKPGANQIIGLEYVHRQPADGYTLILTYISPLAALPVTVKNLSFDPLKDFPPITTVFRIPIYLVAPKAQPWTSFQQFVAHAKANPGKLNWGSSTPPTRLTLELMLGHLGLNLVYVPYTAAGPLLQAVAANEIQLAFTNEQTVQTLKDRITPLAVSGLSRAPSHPQLPTLSELGVPQIPDARYMLNIRAGTPQPIVDKLYSATVAALNSPELREAFAKFKFTPVGDTAESAGKMLAEEAEAYKTVARRVGFVAE